MSSAARTTRPPKPAPAAPEVAAWGRPVARFTVEQYHRMMEAGAFDDGRQRELIHGLILEKPVPNPPHCRTTRRIIRRLIPHFPEPAWVVAVQGSITLADSEPQPDFYVAVGPDDRYDDRHPGPKDLVLVVEVSDTSRAFDRGAKLAMYARAKVVQYWIIDVKARRVEVYTDPRGGRNPGYKTQTDYGPGDAVPVVVGGADLGSIPVNDLLP